jgi:hypothetical protein
MKIIVLLALVQGPQSVYHIAPSVDIPVTLGAGVALTIPYLSADRLITPRCPCDPRRVNAFDRGAIGNKSEIAKTLSDVTVVAAIVAPLVFDAVDLGGLNATWREDALVFVQRMRCIGSGFCRAEERRHGVTAPAWSGRLMAMR